MTMVQVVLFLVLSSKWVFGFYEPTMVVPGVGCGTTKEYSTWKNVLPEAKYPPCALLKSQQAREAYKDVIPRWYEASPWTTCSKTCGLGQQTRTRKCQTRTGKLLSPEDCHVTGITNQTRHCSLRKCTYLTPWSEWSNCAGTCGPILKSRNRFCQETDTQINHPKEYCNGGNLTDFEDCNLDRCPNDGGWSSWTAEPCPVTCGGFPVNRTRTCDNPPPQEDGLPCPGLAIESVLCGNDPCPIDGAWTDWTPWSNCPVTCEGGNQNRSRTCTNPAPQFGGVSCPDAPSIEFQECNTQACPVDGGWSEWSPNSECTVTCGGGTSNKTRRCTNPFPSNGGADCLGDGTEVMTCNEDPCPIPGNWNSWSSWGTCDGPVCGTGFRTRTRDCGAALHGGNQICSFPSTESESDSCNLCSSAFPPKMSEIVAPTSLYEPSVVGSLSMKVCSSDDLCCSLGSIDSKVNVGTTILNGQDLNDCEDKCFSNCVHPIKITAQTMGIGLLGIAPRWTTTSFLLVFKNNVSVQCPGLVVPRSATRTATCLVP